MSGDLCPRHQLPSLLGLTAAVALLTACSQGKEGQDSSHAGGTAAVASTSSGATAASPARSCDGTKKTHDMDQAYGSSMDLDKLNDYIQSIGFDCKEKHQPRVCKQDSNTSCKDAKKDRADITVAAAQGSNIIGSTDANAKVVTLPASSHGYVIARFTNNDQDKTEDWLQIPPHETAYWLIEPNSGGVRSHFFTLDKVGNTFKKTELATIDGFGGCGRPGTHPEETGFADCDLSPYSDVAKPLSTVEDVKSSWISCVAGCCTTEGVRGPKGLRHTTKKAAPGS